MTSHQKSPLLIKVSASLSTAISIAEFIVIDGCLTSTVKLNLVKFHANRVFGTNIICVLCPRSYCSLCHVNLYVLLQLLLTCSAIQLLVDTYQKDICRQNVH